MIIRTYADLHKYTLTSSITVKDINLLKKYAPAMLKKQDADGNDLFAVSYSEGHPSISAFGVTFGSTSSDGGFAMITGDLPETLPNGVTYGDFVADKVGSALHFINAFEEEIPHIVEEINNERAALIGSIVEG